LRLEKRDSDTQKQLRHFKGEVEDVKKNEHEVKKREEAVKKCEEDVKKREGDGSRNDVVPEGHVPVRKRKQVRTLF
jgi:CRISPR/Cas system-associated endonuclease/helicase Cas3